MSSYVPSYATRILSFTALNTTQPDASDSETESDSETGLDIDPVGHHYHTGKDLNLILDF